MDLGRGSVTSLLAELECGLSRSVMPNLLGHSSFVRRMRVDSTLIGHTGCVNRLAFSSDAGLVLSGSDDCTLRIWSTSPPSVDCRAVVTPGHFNNVFGVSFMPNTSNSYVASAGLDCQVRHTHVDTSRSTLWTCHERHVKTVSALDAHSFVTASFDGTARLIDVRQSPTAPIPIVASYSNPRYPTPLNSAIPSPSNPHHLLVAGNDPCVRVFDFRVLPSSRSNSAMHPRVEQTTDIPYIEQYCPPYYHSSSPERCTSHFYRNCTYANFSQDGNHIVASYLEDNTVAVFDRPTQTRSTLCRPSFRSSHDRRVAISTFSLQLERSLQRERFPFAVAIANSILHIEPTHVFALIAKSISLICRRNMGDFRTAFGTLRRLHLILSENPSHVLGLRISTDVPTSPSINLSSKRAKESATVWLKIIEFLQMECLYHMFPPMNQIMILGRESRDLALTIRRLEHLDQLCTRLESYKAQCCRGCSEDPENDHPWLGYVRRHALDLSNEQAVYIPTSNTPSRQRFLSRVVERFVHGIDHVRERIRDSMNSTKSTPNQRVSVPGWNEDTEIAESVTSDSDGVDGDYPSRPWRESNGSTEGVASDGDDEEIRLWGPLSLPQDYRSFQGHISGETEIKEANFFGANDQVILSGSDDGCVYMWSTATGKLINRVEADEQIVNCVLGHPFDNKIIASGIDNTIKVLTPAGNASDVSLTDSESENESDRAKD